MKTRNLLGLAVLAAVALTVSLGSGTALAKTTLCKSNVNQPLCPASERYPSGTSLQAKTESGAKLVIAMAPGYGSVSCDSSLEGTSTAEVAQPLPVTFSSWSLSSCEALAGGSYSPCETTFVKLPSGSLSWTTGSKGTMQVKVGESNPEWHVNCEGLYDCIYSAPSALTFEGGNPAKLAASETSLTLLRDEHSPFGGCAKSATLKATSFTVNSPKPVYVAQPPLEEAHTRLCKSALYASCPSESTYPFGTTIEAEAPSLEINNHGWKATCGKTTLSLKTQAVGAEPLPLGSMAFNASECLGLGNCTLKMSNPSTAAGIERSNAYEGQFVFYPESLLTLTCGTFAKCTYWMAATPAKFHGGEGSQPAYFSWTNAPISLWSGEGACTSENFLTAKFTVTNLNPLFAV